MLSNSYIKSGEVIADAATEIGDRDFGMLGRPFYASALQRAVQDLCFDGNWDRKHWETEIPENLIVDLPNDIVGLENVYIFNGDDCTIGTSKVVYIKPNMWHKGAGGFLANNRLGVGNDSLQWNGWWGNSAVNLWTHYAGWHDGKLYLSIGCKGWQKIHVEYDGMGFDQGCWGDDVKIPQWAREAVTDFVIFKAALALESRSPQYFARVVARKEAQLNVNNSSGSWFKALDRYKRMDPKERRDVELYISRTAHTFF